MAEPMTEHRHEFVFFCQELRGVSWDNFRSFDVYYCKECLEYKWVDATMTKERTVCLSR
jgi:hypothetical protein